MKLQPIQYTGKKAKIGSICFIDNRMCTFVGYCPGCNGKVVMDFDEARDFAKKFVVDKKRTSNVLAIRLMRSKRLDNLDPFEHKYQYNR